MDRIEELDQAIAALEAQRPVLGDAVVDTALAPLAERRADLMARAAGEQRKLVTVLFSDLVGFTAMSETLDPEDVRSLLEPYFSRWRAAIERHGGAVEKYIGDAVMAVFGLHRAQEDDAEQAIRAALDMRDELTQLNAELSARHGVELAMRIGIDTGDVVVSTLDDRPGQDFVVVGDIVNRASRIQSAAPVGGILVSHDTYRHVRGVFRAQQAEPLVLKGVREPVPVYEVLGARTRSFRMGTRGVEGVETRTVGRDLELNRLQELFDDVVDDRRWRVVTVVGEAGVGKSRLLYDFHNWAEVNPEVVRYFAGRALPSTRNQPNGLLRDVVAFRFEVRDSDPPAEVLAKVEHGFGEVLGTDQAGMAKAHLVARWLGFELDDRAPAGAERDPQAVRDRAVAHLGEYFARLTDLHPVVILLEDLHWADDTSLDWIDAMAPHLADRPVLVVATTRPALFEHRPHWGEGLEHHNRLHLERLTRRESRRLLAEILQRAEHVPESLSDLVVTAAEGNPFYIEELVKWLVEEGVVEPSAGAWSVHEDRVAGLRVPATLKGVLQARLDALPPEERLLLQRASVIGRVFWDDALGHLGAVPTGEPTAVLDQLRRREVVYQREQSAFERTSEFVFKHALLRDVTYDSVLRAQRRTYHGLVARWLEQVTERRRRADEYAAAIAEHYEQADEPTLAATWYVRAGRQASRLYADAEAARLLTRAVELAGTDDPGLRFDALLAREAAFDRMADRPAQNRDVEAMQELEPSLDPARRVRLLLVRSRLAFFQSEYATQSERAREAAELARSAGLADLEAEAYLFWGKGLTWQGAHAEANEALGVALERARAAGEVPLVGETLRYLSIVAGNQSEFAAAMDLLQQARQLFHDVGDLDGESQVTLQMGTVLYNKGDYAAARACLEEALPVFELTGFRYARSVATSNLAIIAFGQGRFGEARRRLTEGLALNQQMDDLEGEAISLGMLGDLARSVGDRAHAVERLEESLAIARRIESPYVASDALLLLGFVALDDARLDDALRLMADALDAGRRAESPMEEARAMLGQGYALLAVSLVDEAAAAFAEAEKLMEGIGLEKAVHEARAGRAAAALARRRVGDAVAHVEKVLPHLTADDLEGSLRVGDVFTTAWSALTAAEDQRAGAVLDAAAAFLAEIGARIDDEELRAGFLERVPGNRALVELCRRHR